MSDILTALSQLQPLAVAFIIIAVGLMGVGVYFVARPQGEAAPPGEVAGPEMSRPSGEPAASQFLGEPRVAAPDAGGRRPVEVEDPIGWYEHYRAELEEAQAAPLNVAVDTPAAPEPATPPSAAVAAAAPDAPVAGETGPAPEPAVAESSAPAAAPDAPPNPAQAAPVVSIWQDPRTGDSAIIVNGQRYASLLELPEDLRPLVVHAVDNLIEFGLKTPGTPDSEPPALVHAPPAPRLETGSRTITPRPVLADPYDEARKRHERIKRISSLAGSLIPGPQEPSTPAFFEAINAIIARRIEENDDLRGRSVVMRTDAEGDMQVIDGTQIFPSVDEVADDALRALIKASIAEWEQS